MAQPTKVTKEQALATVLEFADPQDWGWIGGAVVGAGISAKLGTPVRKLIHDAKKAAN
ncbi:hypothetical protein SEA_SUPPI_40 [Arthrobacter phage Suppi]|uniref:Uncharacterized protein n=5 Tax=Korravirus TaxID=1982076 RepID=A0A1D8ESR0_9CAUD|nr:hypothetical protein FDH63_gp40 [Arthrobacter phage Wayne]YP_010050209.1 hypothetical protein KDJ02_gp40 [Arthrobacter phage Litotes]AOT24068.1 hypothetical protein SEA_SUPPI_40 [Arthrobacter phage Suppi]ASR83275.1 hypothetical protein SEA_CANOWICAKTE_40 [Arthrobacter phage Canowicakte]AZF97676.1 hypothetical protein SEA_CALLIEOMALLEY_40 [Arthrobacter phage CallieOMalley]QHB47209.1 hypothetical protein SEA_APPLECIDER_40 [Arthrobacter phage AppleCider]ALY10765.1 hypothetical protein PBI_WAY